MNYLISRRRLEVYWYLGPLSYMAFQFCMGFKPFYYYHGLSIKQCPVSRFVMLSSILLIFLLFL